VVCFRFESSRARSSLAFDPGLLGIFQDPKKDPELFYHRVDRVLGLLSSRPNWDGTSAYPPLTSNFAPLPPPPLVPGYGTHSLAGRGDGGGVGPNSDEGTDTVVLFFCFFTY
jgi:hypothetical protein